MENEGSFRKVKDKLAGFETDFRDDAWRLFEQHRLKKERNRKLAGAVRTAVLALVITAILTGSWLLLESGKAVSPSARSATAVSKPFPGTESIATGKPCDRRSHGIVVQSKAPATTAIVGRYSKSGKTDTRLLGTVSALSDLISPRHDSRDVSPPSVSVSSGVWKGLPNKGPSLYEVNLHLPVIQQSGMNVPGDSGRAGRRFQLSFGPAVRANYAKPSENRLTLGPAVSGTFPITSKLSLRGGLALMREHVYVSNTNPVFTKNAVKWLNRGDYRWWELEIPVDMQVNLYHSPKYRLSGLFGVSSSLSWGEHYREIYQKDKIVTTTLALYDGQVREVQGLASKQEAPVTGRSAGAVFAPATYVNASVILEKKVTSKHSVLIEPQLRYPIGGVTSRNLKFTSIGLQIRMSY